MARNEEYKNKRGSTFKIHSRQFLERNILLEAEIHLEAASGSSSYCPVS